MARLGVAELQEGTYSLMATVQDAGERVQRTRAEAQELLKWVQDSWSRLEGTCLGHSGAGTAWSWSNGRVRVTVRTGVGGSGLGPGQV